MLDLFIAVKGCFSPKIALLKNSRFFNSKLKRGIFELPNRVDPGRESFKRGFSLVEMLMALLVASLLLAALAPVITRKAKVFVNSSQVQEGVSSGMKCFRYQDTIKGKIDVSLNDKYNIGFVIVSAGGGGAGATTETTDINTYNMVAQANVDGVSGEFEIPLDKNMDDFNLEIMTSGGGGGGGGTALIESQTPSEKACRAYGSINGTIKDMDGNTGDDLVVYDKSGLCVTKYNQWARAGCLNNGYEHLIPEGFSYGCTLSDSANTTKGKYSGCGRKVCIWTSAKAGCKYFNEITLQDEHTNWRLPKLDELKKWTSVSTWQALQLCDWRSTTYVPMCHYAAGEDGTTIEGLPHHIWSDAGTDEGNDHYYWFLSGGTNTGGPAQGTEKRSTRCVADKLYGPTVVAGGGGGSASVIDGNVTIKGALTVNEVLTREVRKFASANQGYKLRIVAGGGGAGGAAGDEAAGVAAKDGVRGYYSMIIIYKEDYSQPANIGFKIAIQPGGGGGAATKNAGGAAGKPGGNCYYEIRDLEGNITESDYFTCRFNGANGTAGTKLEWWNFKEKLEAHQSEALGCPIGGCGGKSYLGAHSLGGGYSCVTGKAYALDDATYPGAGGGGGRGISVYSKTEEYIVSDGSRGSGGKIALTYKKKYPGAGGGGGGGGSLLHIPNLYIGKTAVCTLNIGSPGSGGNIDSDGVDGGQTTIKCSTDPRTFKVNGGFGGKIGTSAANINDKPVGGKGGAFGVVENANSLAAIGIVENGASGVTPNNTEFIGKGGNGGASGIQTPGGCAGMYSYDSNSAKCIVDAVLENSSNGNAARFKLEDVVIPNMSNIINSIYGTAGAGGGGGRWIAGTINDDGTRSGGAGTGADGLGGYACIYWSGNNGG